MSLNKDRYYTGKPCKYAHLAERYVRGSHCVECAKERTNTIILKIGRKAWNQKTKDYVIKNPDKVRNTKLKTLFGITVEQYNEMFEQQNGVCAICKQSCITYRMLAVDHCHITGHVRGLLCSRCNIGLGQFCDNIDYLNSAIEYLKK